MNIDAQSIRKAFLDIRDKLAPYGLEDFLHGDPALFRPILEQVSDLAGLPVDESLATVLEADTELLDAFSAINALRSLYCPRLEVERAKSVIKADDPWEALAGFIFYPNYQELARMEVSGANLAPGNHVVFLGSGPCPLSCVTLCRNHGLTCTGIERDPVVAELSRDMVSRLGLEHSLLILDGDHSLLPLPGGADLVMVASAAEPKKAIFRRLAEHLPAGAKVSYRTHEKGLRRLINRDNTLENPDGFRETNRVRPKPPVINTCVFLEKI